MKITGTVKETLHLEKTVKIEIHNNADTMEICTALRQKACKITVENYFPVHRWETVGSEGIDVSIVDEAFETIVEVCCHRVSLRYWNIYHELTPELEAVLTEEGKERADKCIQEGYRSGELCCLYHHDGVEEEIQGGWEISS